MKAVWNVFSAIWMLAAGAIAAMVLFYGLLFFSMNPRPWNFPGDPPFFELLEYCGIASVLLSIPLWLLARRIAGTPQLVLSAARMSSIASFIAVFIATAGISTRATSNRSSQRGSSSACKESSMVATIHRELVLNAVLSAVRRRRA